MKTFIFTLFIALTGSASAMEFKLKLHKVVGSNCRIMFFESSDSTEFFIEKFSMTDNRKFSEYSSDPIAFMKLERPRFGYEETLGHKSKNHIVSLIERDVVLKYNYSDESGETKTEEVALFQNVSCE